MDRGGAAAIQGRAPAPGEVHLRHARACILLRGRGHLRLVLEFGIGRRGELLRHLELVSEIEFGLSWIPMDGLRLVIDLEDIACTPEIDLVRFGLI